MQQLQRKLLNLWNYFYNKAEKAGIDLTIEVGFK